ncbi:SET and MYND domain-containing protein 4-like isoform X2 [Periplaneta americana]|uniref:SET and MYND domain-containing protein 4-like isoform X2 n=1 Tax=Periplaneta americana TaxID=6978 RepID=UPI0037E75B10
MKVETVPVAVKTLDTESGYLKSHHSNLHKSVNEEELNDLSTLKNDEDRFVFVYKLPIVHEYEVKASDSGKNETEAKQLKDEGNKAFQNGKYFSALLLYTKSIRKTPWGKGSTKDLAITVANRSAAFYYIQKYEQALQDIEFVFSLDYPHELHYKVLDRKARCLLATKQLKDALEAFRCTLTALDSAKLPVEKKHKMQLDVRIMLAMMEKNNALANEQLPEKGALPPVTGKQNSRYVSASSLVSIKENEDMGRYAVAGKDVNVGDTLIIEPAFTAVLLGEHAETHCFHCFRRLEAAVPCHTCSNVAFCSVACQTEALATHHAVECTILETLWASGASIICLMALRILSQRGLKYFLDLRDCLSKDCDVVKKSEKYCPTDYRTVYNLVGHSGARTPLDFLFRTDTAVLLFRCLKVAGFFSGQISESVSAHGLTSDEIFVGGLLLRHLQLLQFNAHEVSELQLEATNKLNSARSVFLGGGLFPTLALFNHACDPGIIRYFQGTSVIVRAIKNIQCGEMIAENYGQIFTQTPRAERRAILKSQYRFDCVCVPCQEDWPLFSNMHQGIMRFRCETGADGGEMPRCSSVIIVPTDTSDFMIQCHVCKQYTNILKGLKILQDTDEMFHTATRLMNEGKVKQALEKYIEILILLDKTLVPPFKDFHLCQQAIRRCMLSLGNTSIVPHQISDI